MKKFKNLERLLPHMDAAFTSFYERMLGDVRMSVFFKDAQQITNLIAMQKKHLIQSLTLSQDEMRKSYIKLGEYHYDIRIPYVDFMKGTEILEEYFLLHTQEGETSIELMNEIFGYFKIMKGFTAKGYLNRMLEEDKRDIESFFDYSDSSKKTHLPKNIVMEKVEWLKSLLDAIEKCEAFDWQPSETLLSDWLNEVPFLSLEKRDFFENLEKRISINTQNLFYFLQKEEYLEILPLYTSLLGIYKLTLMMNNAITIEYANHVIDDMEMDALTGLFRKDLFEKMVAKEIAMAWRDKNYRFSVVYLDLDNFKGINDTFGHYSGDKVIEQVGKAIRNNIRASDIGFRNGGDEFAIILKHATSDVAKQVAQKVKGDFGGFEFLFNETTVFNVSMSMGIEEYVDGTNLETFLKNVDAKLYEAKEKGKNQISF